MEVQSGHGTSVDRPPEMSGEQVLAVALIGAAVGLLGGLFGKGGSAIATPLLSLVGIPPISAVASPLPATIPSTLSASYAYWRERLIDWRVVGWSAAVGVPATVCRRLRDPLDRRKRARDRHRGDPRRARGQVPAPAGRSPRGRGAAGRVPDPAVPGGRGRRRGLRACSPTAAASSSRRCSSWCCGCRSSSRSRRRWRWRRCSRCRARSCTPRSVTSTGPSWAYFAATSIPLSYVGARLAVRTQAVHLERAYGAGLALLGTTLLIAGL